MRQSIRSLGGVHVDLGSSWSYLLLAAVAVFFIARQFVASPVRERALVALPLIAGLIGVQALVKAPPQSLAAAALIIVNLGLAAVLGVARGATLKVWRARSGTWMFRGGTLTLLLWLAAIGIRIAGALVFPAAMSFGELPLFLAVTFGAQNLLLWLRMKGGEGGAIEAG
jgi:hypothetical protein